MVALDSTASTHKPQFAVRPLGFTIVLAVLTLVAAVLVARQQGVALLDPDGDFGPAYVILPVLVCAALALDTLPRIIWRLAHGSKIRPVVSSVYVERLSWPALRYTLIGLAAWYGIYAAIRNLKGFVPYVNTRLWDPALARLDQWSFFGHDPAAITHVLLGTGVSAHVLSAVYIAWIGLLPVSIAAALVWRREATLSSWWITAVAIDWTAGVLINYVLPTLGPIYAHPQTFEGLAHTRTTELQTSMWAERVQALADPAHAPHLQNIAAFASLHVAIAATAVVVAFRGNLAGPIKWALTVFLVLTVIATVYFGWHYVSDVVAGFALGWLAARLGAWTSRYQREDPGDDPPSARDDTTAVHSSGVANHTRYH